MPAGQTGAGMPAAPDGRLSRPILWLMVAISGLVFVEPAPYEFAFLLLCWALFVERLPVPAIMIVPTLLLVLLFNIGGMLSLVQVIEDAEAVRFIVISVYLALTTLVVGSVIAANPLDRLRLVGGAWILAAVVTALTGILGYFTGSELLTLHDRARGLFKDPNVYGPFLVFPALLLMQDVLGLSGRKLLRAALPLGFIAIGILLSFSRAAWAHFLLSALVLVYLMLVTSPSPVLRLRLVIGAFVALMVLGGVVAAMLTIPEVREIFEVRAGAQEYDVGETGRFGSQLRSIPELLDRPLGYGPLQFALHHGEAPHNVYINAFSAYGWLGGASYFAFVVITLWLGVRVAFADLPWRRHHQAVLAAFVGVALTGLVVDTDHWRHFYLLAGLLWGSAAAALARDAARAAPARRPAVTGAGSA